MAWNWESVKAEVLAKPVEWAGLLNTRMAALENHLMQLASVLPVDGVVRTTDATVTTLRSIAVPVDTTLYIDARVVARRTGGIAGAANDGAAYRLEVSAKNLAGTAAEIAAETLTVIGEDQAGWTIASSASGGNILLRVTGAVDTNVTWKSSVKTLSCKS